MAQSPAAELSLMMDAHYSNSQVHQQELYPVNFTVQYK